MSQGSQVLLFDLGGVLMDFAGLTRLRALLADPGSEDELRNRWLASSTVRDFELGNITPHAFAERFVREWGLDQTPDVFLGEFGTWARGFYPGMPQMLAELRASTGIACLSNSNEVHMAALRPSMVGCFERQFISCELGLAKPDPEIFELVVAELGVPAAEITFFDDSRPNVEAAIHVGMAGELVRGPDQLRERLHAVGFPGFVTARVRPQNSETTGSRTCSRAD